MNLKQQKEDLEIRQKKALYKAVSALYFGDNSDFVGYFHEIIMELSAFDEYLNEDDISNLYKKLNPEYKSPKEVRVLSQELFDQIHKHVPDNCSFESCLLTMKVGKEYDLMFIQLAIDFCNDSY